MLHEELQTVRGEKLLTSEIGEEIYELFGMLERYTKWKSEYTDLLNENRMKIFNKELPAIEKQLEDIESEVPEKKQKLQENGDEMNLICKPTKYIK
jgi:Fe-S cluster biosynthesis and repair protein YggX